MEYLELTRPKVLKNFTLQRQLTLEVREELDRAFVDFFREKKVM